MLIDSIAPNSKAWTAFDAGVASLDAFLCRGASTKPLAVVVAGVHGDEYEGPAAVARLSECLQPRSLNGSVVAVPVANPMAFGAGQRLSPDDGLNLARTFPGNPAGSPTERLAAWLFENVVRGADYLIDLHSGGVEYRFLPLAGFYGLPEPSNRSYRAARHFGLPALWQLPETAGVLSLEAWKIGIVAIGCEYLGGGQLSAQGVSCYADGVLSCLALWGLLDQARRKPESGQVLKGDWQLAQAPGLFRCYCQLGERVEAGRLLGEIVDPRGATLQSLVSSEPGVILALRSKAYIREGNWGVLVASD